MTPPQTIGGEQYDPVMYLHFRFAQHAALRAATTKCQEGEGVVVFRTVSFLTE